MLKKMAYIKNVVTIGIMVFITIVCISYFLYASAIHDIEVVIRNNLDISDYLDKIYKIKAAALLNLIVGLVIPCIIGFVVWRQNKKILHKNDSLAKYSAELEKANEQLLDATKVAERATLSKTNFLANMSHEIRTPMNGVLGIAGLLSDTKLDPSQKELVDIIRKSGDLLLEIVNDILDISKIEAGELSLEPVNFSLKTTVNDIVNMLSTAASEQEVNIDAQIEDKMPEFYCGDVVRVRQIIMNLMSNSIKFTNKGSVILYIRHEDVGEKKARLFFEVEDTGIGIPEDKLDYIFNKFTQAEESTTRKFGGTGLGLAICKNLTHMMGGSVGVRSKLGVGSTFYFDIILPYGEKMETETDDQKVRPKFSNTRILVVDDMKLNMMLLIKILEKYECKIDMAVNGKEAVSMVKKNEYDMILMDCHMPEMDGYEATREIRKLEQKEKRNHVPIVAITADAMKDNYQRCIDSGMNDYLNKPVKEQQVQDMLLKWLTKNYMPVKGKKLLVIEDSNVNRMVIGAILEEMECIVDEAERGLAAVSKLTKQAYDIIILDVNLPELSGYEVIEIIRQGKTKNSTTPILVMTSTDTKVVQKELGENIGFVKGFIDKPIRKDQVVNILNTLCLVTNESKLA